nr:hypothetical protein CFP56_10418 [Quercus suber]
MDVYRRSTVSDPVEGEATAIVSVAYSDLSTMDTKKRTATEKSSFSNGEQLRRISTPGASSGLIHKLEQGQGMASDRTITPASSLADRDLLKVKVRKKLCSIRETANEVLCQGPRLAGSTLSVEASTDRNNFIGQLRLREDWIESR